MSGKKRKDIGAGSENRAPKKKKSKVEEDKSTLLSILERLDKIQEELKAELIANSSELKAELKANSSELKAELKANSSELKALKVKFESDHAKNELKENNPWWEMSQTDRTRQSNLRKAVFQKLGVTDATVACWLSRGQGSSNLKVAHILPDSTKKHIWSKLGLTKECRNDINANP
jgi:hypothetical protein